MPLSEHEQRLLEQMERALHEEDPKLASTMRQASNRSVNGRQVMLGSVLVVLGLVGLLGGVTTNLVVLGAVGFLLMLGGTLFIGAAFRAPAKPTSESENGEDDPAPTAGKAKSQPKAKGPNGGFMSKVEDRWRKRRETDGF
ncbi:MAG: DUF3040 domain-containing protein [Actinobacteria bacterium]|nr:DUF3040 domain-containing protein [Actinomycetota bacterium]